MIITELRDDRSEKIRYDYADYPIYIKRALLSSYPNYAAPAHWHDDIEMTIILSGEMQYNVNQEIVTLRENEAILVNARQLHFGFSTKKIECDFICVLLHPLILCANYAYERDFVLPILSSHNVTFVKLTDDAEWQRRILGNIKLIYSYREKETAPLKIQSVFSDIWLQLYENIALEDHPSKQNTDLSVIKKMIGFIQQNYTVKISLADIAAAGAA